MNFTHDGVTFYVSVTGGFVGGYDVLISKFVGPVEDGITEPVHRIILGVTKEEADDYVANFISGEHYLIKTPNVRIAKELEWISVYGAPHNYGNFFIEEWALAQPAPGVILELFRGIETSPQNNKRHKSNARAWGITSYEKHASGDATYKVINLHFTPISGNKDKWTIKQYKEAMNSWWNTKAVDIMRLPLATSPVPDLTALSKPLWDLLKSDLE